MENGVQATDAAAAGGGVVREEEDPASYAAAVDAGAELMATPRAELADLATPDATTPVMRGPGKDFYGEEPDVFEEAVQEDPAAGATPPPPPLNFMVDDAYGDLVGVANEGQYDVDQPPVSIANDDDVDGGPREQQPYEPVLGAQVEEQHASEAGGAGSAPEPLDVAPNSGEVIGGYDDDGPGPETSFQPDDYVPVVDNTNGDVVEDPEMASAIPVDHAPDTTQYQEKDMQVDDVGEIQQNGNHGQYDYEDPNQQHTETLENGDGEVLLQQEPDRPLGDGEVLLQQEPDSPLGDGEVLLQQEPDSPLGDGEVLHPPEAATASDFGSNVPVPHYSQDDGMLPLEDALAAPEEITGSGDGQEITAEYPLKAASQDVTDAGSRGLPDTDGAVYQKDDDEDEVVDDDGAPPHQVEGDLSSPPSVACFSPAVQQNSYDSVFSDYVDSQEDPKLDKIVTKAADVESPPKKLDDTTSRAYSNGSFDDHQDEEESPFAVPPPITAAAVAAAAEPSPTAAAAAAVPTELKASATSQSHPSGLGSSAPLPEPAARLMQQQPPRVNGSVAHQQAQPSEDVVNGGVEVEEYDETREKLQMIRVKFLRLAHRLGQTPHNVVVAQVLYRLGLAEQLRGSMNSASRAGAFSFDRASALAEQLEAAGQEPLDFACTIMVIGKTGVGKSATINSIFDEVRLKTDAFQLGTKKVQEIFGTVQGIKVRVIDTPGLLPSLSDQMRNEKILQSVKQFIKKNPPDVIMYLDRLDMQNRDLGDIPLLRTITNIFGPSIWFNAIVVLTHAASAPPEGANGSPLSYEMYVTQRTHVIQNAIRQAAGDPRLLNPVSLVENHSACRMNRAGQRVLPNGQVWKPHLLLLSFASKILTEANMLLKLQDAPASRPFGGRHRSPPLPFFLSSLLQSRPHLRLPDDQFGDDDTAEMDVGDESESDEEPDYDELPPFKRLTNEQISGLSKAQRKAYFEELDYRERLFFKKQFKEERRRRRLLKKMAAEAQSIPEEYSNEAMEDENNAPATVPVPMPDMTLPASFDSDYPSHRYRFLDSASQWIVRPVLETQGWDHDIGYEGVNIERMFVVRDKIPLSVSGQLTKDKKDFSLQMEMASSLKHSEGKSTAVGLDVQSIGKDMAYTLRGETRFANFRRNTTATGVSATLLGDTLSAGLKIEDKLTLGKRFKLLISGGAMSGRGDMAYGGRLEATLRDKDYPLGRLLSTLALSVVDWHGDLAVGCNLQSQIPVGRSTNMTAHASLNNRGTGQIGVRVNSTEQLLLAAAALVPLFGNARKYVFGSSESM